MVGDFLRKAADALLGDQSSDFDDQRPRPASEDPYGDPADQMADEGQFGNVQPASEDPYGDPADQFGNIRSASQDPYGDPADQMANEGQFGNIRSADEDPYGDPADSA